MMGAQALAQGTGGLLGGYTSNSQTPSTGSTIANLAGTALSMIPFLPSDERLKTDIKKVGQTDGGLPIYTYKYKGDDTPQMGVMAQEVEKKQPEALGPLIGGYRTVKYAEVR
jgi:hypothetical protein